MKMQRQVAPHVDPDPGRHAEPARMRESRRSASASPTISESTMAMSAISRLIRKPSRMKRRLLPVISHSQLSGSKT